MNYNKPYYLIAFLLLSATAVSQNQDSLLTEKQVLEIVRMFHPVVKQADIGVKKAQADITTARGMFDPSVSSGHIQKTFDGTDYYNYSQSEITIPVWFGMNLTAGVENVKGSRTDPQETPGQTSFAGVSIPLAKNLLMDKRRAVLIQSKIFRQLSEEKRKSMINDLSLEAITYYWNWVQSYQQKEILQQTVQVNRKRLQMVVTAYQQGDRPAIDTTEALAQLQSFELALKQAELDFKNAGMELAVFFWNENEEPVLLPDYVIPDTSWNKQILTESEIPALDQLLSSLQVHPDILQIDSKLGMLNVEKRLKFQELLPDVNFRYNRLGSGYRLINPITTPLFENNFQYGISVGVPLRLSQGRGEFRRARLSVEETRLEKNLKTRNIENNIRTTYNEIFNLLDQIRLMQAQYSNYLNLQRGEEIRYFNGESSLFMINTRENRTLESLQNLIRFQVSSFIVYKKLLWASGLMSE